MPNPTLRGLLEAAHTLVSQLQPGRPDSPSPGQQEALIGSLRNSLEDLSQALEMQESVDKFFDLALDLLCIANTDGYFIRLNPMWEKVLGYTQAELLSHSFLHFVHRDDRDSTLAALQNLEAQKPVWHFENRYRCQDGTYRWIEWNSFSDGKLIYAAARDVTESKQLQEALRENEARYRSLFEDSPIALWEEDMSMVKVGLDALRASGVSDLRAYFNDHPDEVARLADLITTTNINQAALRLFHAKSIDALYTGTLDQHYGAVTSGSKFDLFREELIARAAGAIQYETEGPQYTLDGEQFYAFLRIAIAPGYEATWAKAFVSIIDITARRKAEHLVQVQKEQLEVQNEELQAQNEELLSQATALAQIETQLRQLNAQLEQRVADRTAELSARTQDLSLANAALVRAARLKDEFLASMSHELRTPLTGILGMTEVLHMGIYGALAEKQLKAVDDIFDSGQHLLDLINDILDVSKIEAGKLELQPAMMRVMDVCQGSLQFVRPLAQKKNLRLITNQDAAVNVIQADARRVKQMLVNLLSNGVKFTDPGGTVGLDVAGDIARREVRFTVWDTGIGIAPEDLPRLFQPFVQLDSRLSREYPGTGLGLSLVMGLAEAHGGRVEVESDLGKGSRFTIILPWSPEAEIPGNPPAESTV